MIDFNRRGFSMKKHLTKLVVCAIFAAMLFVTACNNGSESNDTNNNDTNNNEITEPPTAQGNGNEGAELPTLPENGGAVNGGDTTDPGDVADNGEAGSAVGIGAYSPFGRPNFNADGTPVNAGILEHRMDLGGRTINMFTQQYNWYILRDDQDETGRNQLELRRRIREIEDDYNFTLVNHNAPNSAGPVMEILIADRAGGLNSFDIYNFLVNSVNQEELFLQGHVLSMCHPSISDIIRFNDNPFHAESELSYMFGRQWGIHILKLNTNNLFRGVVTFNRNLMEDFTLPNFYELFRANEWTWDTFEQISRDFDALSARHRAIVQGGESSFIPHIIASNGGELVRRNDDGTMTFIGDTDIATLEALDWTMRLINDGLLHFDVEVSRFFDTGNALFIMGGYSNLRDRGSTGTIRTDATVGLMPLPRGPRMDGYVTRTFSSAMFYIADGTHNAHEVAAVLVAFANRWPRTNVVEHELAYALMDEESGEVMAYLLNVMGVDLSRAMGSTRSIIADGANSIINNSQTPAQAMQTIAQQVQNELDSMWNRLD